MENDAYCLSCFSLIPAGADICPVCGAPVDAFSALDYREKLVHALLHPLDDVRMRAIIALGLRGEPETADALVECALRHPTDVVAGLEIVRSLARVKDIGVGRDALAVLKERHPAHAVRGAAAHALQGGNDA
ncbi:MAG: HEAT repeat domain-containing protein [Sulfuricellaceae bacterium]|jgi:HEAT repeat protein